MDSIYKKLIYNCASVDKFTRILIIYDDTTNSLLKEIVNATRSITKYVYYEKVNVGDKHGEEPNDSIMKKILNVDLVMCITKYSLAHTEARKKASDAHIMFLSMPDWNVELMENDAIKCNYRDIVDEVEKMSRLLTNGHEIKIISENGTDIELDISNRVGNCCPGFVDKKYLLGSPPDVEANIAPNEMLSNGKIVVDGSITHPDIGLLEKSVTLEIDRGKIINIYSDNKNMCEKLNRILSNICSEKVYYLAECGIGFNPLAHLCGNMLVDEGTKGCIHFGFGSNSTIGGKNEVNFHLDFVIKEPDLYIDEKKIIRKGKFEYE